MILQVHFFFHVILPGHTLPIPNHCLWHYNLPLLSIQKQCHVNNIKVYCQLKMEPILMDQLLQPLCIDQEETLSQAVTFSCILSSSFLFPYKFLSVEILVFDKWYLAFESSLLLAVQYRFLFSVTDLLNNCSYIPRTILTSVLKLPAKPINLSLLNPNLLKFFRWRQHEAKFLTKMS